MGNYEIRNGDILRVSQERAVYTNETLTDEVAERLLKAYPKLDKIIIKKLSTAQSGSGGGKKKDE